MVESLAIFPECTVAVVICAEHLYSWVVRLTELAGLGQPCLAGCHRGRWGRPVFTSSLTLSCSVGLSLSLSALTLTLLNFQLPDTDGLISILLRSIIGINYSFIHVVFIIWGKWPSTWSVSG